MNNKLNQLRQWNSKNVTGGDARCISTLSECSRYRRRGCDPESSSRCGSRTLACTLITLVNGSLTWTDAGQGVVGTLTSLSTVRRLAWRDFQSVVVYTWCRGSLKTELEKINKRLENGRRPLTNISKLRSTAPGCILSRLTRTVNIRKLLLPALLLVTVNAGTKRFLEGSPKPVPEAIRRPGGPQQSLSIRKPRKT
jgi:hypothetical protein